MARALVVHAHPEPLSFTSALKDAACAELGRCGYEVIVSDLYAMRFDPVAKAEDFRDRRDPDYLVYAQEQRHAFERGTLAADIEAELHKVMSADLLVLSFPFYWFSVPAILKGWIDRVLLAGPIYGGRRIYDAGGLAGKRATCLVTAGSREHMLEADGIHGDAMLMLRHLLQGTLGYVGCTVHRPWIAWHVPYVSGSIHAEQLADCRRYFATLERQPILPMPHLAEFDREMRRI